MLIFIYLDARHIAFCIRRLHAELSGTLKQRVGLHREMIDFKEDEENERIKEATTTAATSMKSKEEKDESIKNQ